MSPHSRVSELGKAASSAPNRIADHPAPCREVSAEAGCLDLAGAGHASPPTNVEGRVSVKRPPEWLSLGTGLLLILASQAHAQSFAVDQQHISLGKTTLRGGVYSLSAQIELASRRQTVSGGDFSLQGDWSSLAEPFGFGMLPLISLNHAPVPGTLTVQGQPLRVIKIPLAQILGVAHDPDGDPLQVEIASGSQNGAWVSVQGRWLIYDPGSYYVLPDTVFYQITDGHEWVGGSLAIEAIPGSEDPSQNRVSIRLDGDDVVLDFMGIPGRYYFIQTTPELGAPWQNLAWVFADQFGRIQHIDVGGATAGTRYFRTVAP